MKYFSFCNWQNQDFHHFGSLKFIEIELSDFIEIAVLTDFETTCLQKLLILLNGKMGKVSNTSKFITQFPKVLEIDYPENLTKLLSRPFQLVIANT